MKGLFTYILLFLTISLSGQRIGIIASSVEGTVQTYGSELVTTGDMSAVSVWVFDDDGVNISGGECIINGTNIYSGLLHQDITLVVGTTYKVEFDISSYSSGKLRFILGNIDGNGATNDIDYTSDQHVSVELTYTTPSTNDRITFYSWDIVPVCHIDNVSVKEVL